MPSPPIARPPACPLYEPAPTVALVLRRPLTKRQRRVLELMDEAPSYEDVGHALGISPRTVHMHVRDIADLLPVEFLPRASPKDRVVVYAARLWALGQIARGRAAAA